MTICIFKSILYKSKVAGDMNGLFSGYLIKKRTDTIRPYLKNKKKICDIGCGIFRWQEMLSPAADYIGVDSLQAIVGYNRKHFKYKFFCLDIEADSLECLGNDFDLIIMSAVIEHFADPLKVLRKLSPLLSPCGQIIVTTPHPKGNLILNWGVLLQFFSNDKHTHNDLLDHSALTKLANDACYELREYKRFLMGFNQLVVLEK